MNVMVMDGVPANARLAELGVARISYGPIPYIRAIKTLEQEAKTALNEPAVACGGLSHEHRQSSATTHSVETPSGRISYASAGSGPVALFVHGVVLNKHLWRHQLAGLSDIRRCIAVDLLAHGDTEIAPDQDVSVTANAKMLKEVLDALQIDQVDLVGNDSGGGIAQIFAALNPERVRTLDPHQLRHPRQLAAGGVQAIRGNGHGWRPARHAECYARRQDDLSFARRAWAGL